MKLLFLERVNANRVKRLQQNGEKTMFKSMGKLWVTGVFAYLDVDDCLRMGQVCHAFGNMVKSPLFVKCMVRSG